jgi:hypothetical protein
MKPRYLPEIDRLSVIVSTILLAYALARFIEFPLREFALELPGFYLPVQINLSTVVALLVAGITATGADWLLHEHPALQGKRTIDHWLLPALTAWIIGIPLFQLPLGPLWWVGFALGGASLVLVLVAEYISVDAEDVRQPIAAAGLTAVSFALYLTLAITFRYAGHRLYFILPALTLAVFLVSLRTLQLRLKGRLLLVQSGVIALICAQITAALHYWPATPVTFGLALLGPAYALTSFMASLAEEEPLPQAVIEPALVLILVWGASLWMN